MSERLTPEQLLSLRKVANLNEPVMSLNTWQVKALLDERDELERSKRELKKDYDDLLIEYARQVREAK